MKRNTVIASALALVFAIGLVLMTLRSRDLEQQLREVNEDRASACDQARSVAIGAVHGAVLSARIAKERGMPASLADGSGRALAVYIWACADEDDAASKDMAKALSDLVFVLLQSGELETLAALEARLDETPLDEWKTLALPDGTEGPSK